MPDCQHVDYKNGSEVIGKEGGWVKAGYIA
jgi:hypothetical protein